MHPPLLSVPPLKEQFEVGKLASPLASLQGAVSLLTDRNPVLQF